MDTPSADQFLVDEIREGNQAAWRQLIDRYRGRLLAFARARAPGLSDAEDLVQEAFVGFLQSLGHFDSSRSLETYLFTILRYKLYDLLRQRKLPIQNEPLDAEDWWDRVVPGSEETPSGMATQAEAGRQQARLLGEILRRLIHDYRDREAFRDLQVIELVFFAGMRNLDVGELLDMDQKSGGGDQIPRDPEASEISIRARPGLSWLFGGNRGRGDGGKSLAGAAPYLLEA